MIEGILLVLGVASHLSRLFVLSKMTQLIFRSFPLLVSIFISVLPLSFDPDPLALVPICEINMFFSKAFPCTQQSVGSNPAHGRGSSLM